MYVSIGFRNGRVEASGFGLFGSRDEGLGTVGTFDSGVFR